MDWRQMGLFPALHALKYDILCTLLRGMGHRNRVFISEVRAGQRLDISHKNFTGPAGFVSHGPPDQWEFLVMGLALCMIIIEAAVSLSTHSNIQCAQAGTTGVRKCSYLPSQLWFSGNYRTVAKRNCTCRKGESSQRRVRVNAGAWRDHISTAPRYQFALPSHPLFLLPCPCLSVCPALCACVCVCVL